MKVKFLILFSSITLMICSSCMTHKPAFEGTPLPVAKSASAVLNEKNVATLDHYLSDSSETTGLIVLIDGEVVYEYGDLQVVSYIASCRKSVLSMLYGKYVMDESMDLNQSIGSLAIDEDDGLLDIEKEASIDNIITSRSGVFHLPANGGYDKNNIKERGSQQPGEYFVYNNWDFNVAGHILEQHTGRTVYEELELQLAIPLGFQDWNLKNQKKFHKKKKSRYPAYHIYVSTRDMAKMGQLMLNKGKWKGQQVISEQWIEKSTTEVTPADIVGQRSTLFPYMNIEMAYGYMWWLIQRYQDNEMLKGAFTASGYGGQYITVIPKANMVIAHKTKLSKLQLAGLRKGGVSDWQYYTMLEKIVSIKK